MGYFEKVTEAQFKRSDDGSWIYYPHGFMGKGRRIDSESLREKLHRSHHRLLKILMPTAILGGMVLGMAGAPLDGIAVLVIIMLAFVLNHSRTYSSLPYATDRLTFREGAGKASKALPDWYGKLVILVSVGNIVLALLLPKMLGRPLSEVLDLVAMMLGLGVIGLATGLTLRWVRNRATEDGIN